MSTESIKRIPIEAWGWQNSKCDYCEKSATIFYIDKYACFEHRATLLKEKTS